MIYQKQVRVKGIVQGVGFRPFVYKLALKYDIKGYVNNDDKGVNITISSSNLKLLDKFLDELKNNPPPLAKIDEILITEIENPLELNDFLIIESENSSNKSTLISPDIAICKECTNDINDPLNFRHNYALTNCTNCGPRYSIIKTVPYDRKNTSMSEFKLCSDCQTEYNDPLNRRYHAQPVACEKCGPQLTLYAIKENIISKNIDAIQNTAKLINDGQIVAIKGMGGFHIICDAKNEQTVQKLRDRKNRPSKPFAVMFKSISSIEQNCSINKKEKELLQSKEKPIVLVNSSKNDLSKNIAPNTNRLGVFLPYTPLHILLFRYLHNPIVATSANISGEPIIISKEDIFHKLEGVVDYVLDFNRDIINACDDSIVQVINNEVQILRLARGYAPLSIKLQTKQDKKILAVGANQKNSISITFEDNLILSSYNGDLDSISSIKSFENSIKSFERFYNFKPEIITHDLHKNYESSKWALSSDVKKMSVQHHYAHALSCMCEHNLDEDVLVFAFDGTGLGDDGTIWGGEVLIANRKSYERVYHLKNFKLLGSQIAVKEPRRVALSLLFEIFTLDEVLKISNPCIKSFTENEIKLYFKMWQKSLNSPRTSSMGRFFDAIASLSGLLQFQSYEGESGLLIEKYYKKNTKETYGYSIIDNVIDLTSMILDILNEKDTHTLCSKFLNTLVNLISEIVLKHKNKKIILTGGVFQNKTLLELVIKNFEKMGIDFYYNKSIPINDQGISLGEIFYSINKQY